MHLARLVGAVLAPHHRIHRELCVSRAAAEDVLDPRVLVLLETELGVGLVDVRGGNRPLDGLVRRRRRVAHAATRLLSTDTNIARPSAPGPVSASTACSGW